MAVATSSVGAANAQVLSLKLSHKINFQVPSSVRLASSPRASRNAGFTVSHRLSKTLLLCSGQSSLVIEKESVASKLEVEDEDEQGDSSSLVSPLIPNYNQLKSLLTDICDTNSIAEFKLKLNGFHLHVTRSTSVDIDPPAPSLPPLNTVATSANTAAEVAASNGSVTTSALAISGEGLVKWDSGTLLEKAADEGVEVVQSPGVGYFQRSRIIKGKRAPPSCVEKKMVKEGQVICFIEQLGRQIPVRSNVSGEIIRVLCNDDEPVGYGDALITILPSFPGIKKLSMNN